MARTKERARKRADETGNESVDEEPQNKKVKQQFSLDLYPKKDDEGNQYWSISNKRRLQVSEFKGVTMVSIREYYDKDGKTLPGRGISLPIEQFNAMCELLPQVESVLRTKNLKVTRPQYRDSESDSSAKPVHNRRKENADGDGDDDANDDRDGSIIKPAQSAKSKLDKFKLKANHEATSDEDS